MKKVQKCRASRIGFWGAIPLLALWACQNPASSLAPPPAVVVVFSDAQRLSVEKALVTSGEAVLASGTSPMRVEVVHDPSGRWTVPALPTVAGPTSMTIRLYSGAAHSGLLLFQGSTVLSASAGEPVLLSVNNISFRDESFRGTIETVPRSEVVPVDETTTVVVNYQVDIDLEYAIAGNAYSCFMIETRSDTGAWTKTLASSGTVDRQGLDYAFHKLAQYNTDGTPVTPVTDVDFSLTLDNSGSSLVSPVASDPHLVRQ